MEKRMRTLESVLVWPLALFAFSPVLLVSAQEEPKVIVHPHKIYVDAKENKLYWPWDKPFWVRLAASPDADAPSYLMERVAPESDITTEKYNKDGIALEIEGKQFIRWYNYVTKQTVNLMFFTDGHPPVTKATCSGAPTSVAGAKTYYGVGLHCTLASTDDLSGVETVYLSVDGEPYKPYVAEPALDKEKEVTLRYYAEDHVGYAETPSTLRFTVDLTPPQTNHAVTGNALGDVLSTQAKFRITSSDALSGVATVLARIDGGEYKPVVNGEVSVEALPDGEHTLNYYAIDQVKNREAEHAFRFYLDRLPPTADAQVVGDLWVASNGTRYISRRSQVQLTAQDNKSGVDKIVYSYDGAKFEQYGQPFSPPVLAGAAKVTYRAADRLGNTSVPATLPYSMDLAAPQSNYRVIGPTYQERTDVYITSATRIELSATDDASGVKQIEYQPEDAAQAKIYSEPIGFPEEGRRLLRYWSTDKVNNRELDRAVVLITDNTPPEIFANFSLAAKTSANGEGLAVYRRMTSLFLGATDNASGVHKIYYTINGGKEMEYKTPLVLDHEGTFELRIRADDNLGNQSTKSLRFVIKG
jgi:hypothetical protein